MDGRVTILRFDDEQQFYTLEGLSAEFWFLINGKSSVADIKKALQKKHGDALIKFDRIFELFLGDLKKASLLETRE